MIIKKSVHTVLGVSSDFTNNPPDISDSSLSTSSITDTGFIVNFIEATDDHTPQNDIRYKLYSSPSNNLLTITEVYTNGTLEDQGMGVSFLAIDNKSPGELIYFNVLAIDGQGEESVYQPNSESTFDSQSGNSALPVTSSLEGDYDIYSSVTYE